MSTYTPSLGLEEITPGDQAGLWGNTTNNNLALVDQAVTGVTPLNFTGLSGTTYTLTSFDGAVDEARAAVLNITGIATGSNTIVVPNKQKTYLVRNNTGQNVVFRTASPTATYTVGAGFSILVFCDGNNGVFTGIQSPSTGTLTVPGGGTGATTFTAGFIKSPGGTANLTSASSVVLNSADVSGTLSVTNGGTGASSLPANNVLLGAGASSPTGVAPGASGNVLTSNGTTWVSSAPATGVASFSGGVTGLTPATATTGVITLSGTLEVTSGGTGSTTPTGARANLGIGSVGVINTNGSTTQFLRGDGTWNTPATITSISAGAGILVNGGSGPVTSGAVTISATSTGTVTSVTAAAPLSSTGGTTPQISISTSPTFSGTVTGGALVSNGTISSTGNINTPTGSISVGTGVSGTSYGLLTGSSLQLFGVGTQSMFGNSGLFGWIVNSTNAFAGGVTEFRPGIDNISTSGSSSFRWSAVWAVNGTIQTSDARLKTDVTPSQLGLNFISKLKPVSYKWISGGKVEDGTMTPTEVGGTTMDLKNYKDRPGVRTHYGLIAQEVKQTLDELNVGDFAGWALDDKDDPNSTQALNYGQFIAPLIKAVQELKAELDAAKAEIEALKAQ